MTIWDCRTHVRMMSMTSSVERTDLDFKISAALTQIILGDIFSSIVFTVTYSTVCQEYRVGVKIPWPGYLDPPTQTFVFEIIRNSVMCPRNTQIFSNQIVS